MNAIEFDTNAQVLRVLSPAGLVLLELNALQTVTAATSMLNAVVAKAHGMQVPAVVPLIVYPGPPPLEVVDPVTNPVK